MISLLSTWTYRKTILFILITNFIYISNFSMEKPKLDIQITQISPIFKHIALTQKRKSTKKSLISLMHAAMIIRHCQYRLNINVEATEQIIKTIDTYLFSSKIPLNYDELVKYSQNTYDYYLSLDQQLHAIYQQISFNDQNLRSINEHRRTKQTDQSMMDHCELLNHVYWLQSIGFNLKNFDDIYNYWATLKEKCIINSNQAISTALAATKNISTIADQLYMTLHNNIQIELINHQLALLYNSFNELKVAQDCVMLNNTALKNANIVPIDIQVNIIKKHNLLMQKFEKLPKEINYLAKKLKTLSQNFQDIKKYFNYDIQSYYSLGFFSGNIVLENNSYLTNYCKNMQTIMTYVKLATPEKFTTKNIEKECKSLFLMTTHKSARTLSQLDINKNISCLRTIFNNKFLTINLPPDNVIFDNKSQQFYLEDPSISNMYHSLDEIAFAYDGRRLKTDQSR